MTRFFPRLKSWVAWGVAFLCTLLAPAAARAVTLVGLTDTNRLVLFDSVTPQTVAADVPVTGLQPGEILLGIDFRPATNQLYAIGSTSRLYRIDTVTGAATQVGSGSFAPMLNVSEAGGFEVGFDFDSVQGFARVVSNGQSLRLDADSGTVVALDSPLFNTSGDSEAPPSRTPSVTGIADGSPSPTLYGIDWRGGRLVTIGSRGSRPVSSSTGEVFRVGPLFALSGFQDFSVQLTAKVGFDIAAGNSSLVFASLAIRNAPSSRLYLINLSNGEAYEVGAIGTGGVGSSAGLFLRGLAIMPEGTNLYGVTPSNKLLLFNANMPGAILRSTQITGLQTGESILGINVRLQNGQLYALGSTSRLYIINPESGAATQSNSQFIMPPVAGTQFGVAIDNFHNQMRIVSDAGESWHLQFFDAFNTSSNTSFGTTPGTLRYAADDVNAGQNPRVSGLAWTLGGDGFQAVSYYYGIDADKDTLVLEKGSEFGTLHTIGPLGVETGGFVGFDYGRAPYASLTLNCPGGCSTPSTLYTIDLQTGHATLVGGIGGGEIVHSLTTEPARTVHFSKTSYRVEENCTSVNLVVVRTGDTSSAATIDYATTSEGTLPAPPADERADYNAASGTLRFAAGESVKILSILINEDSYAERIDGHEGEAFGVTLSKPGGIALGTSLDSPSTATVLIVDDEDEVGDSANPIDETRGFVCQQYHDFLNRDPDFEGFGFWITNIDSCPDEQCREVKRIETSAAFFLSIEFQETGFFVYRTYQAAFGRTPVPLTLAEFMRDAHRVGEGVVIGHPGALERLEANKRAFMSEFINRTEFLAKYPFIRPNEAENYVDSLNVNSGGVLSQAERAALIASYQSIQARADILRTVVEKGDSKRLAFDRAFVLSQYFGYLRRNPNDPPDSDFSGFDFWLQKLREHNGDFRQAEMVKSFITSAEYRKRFGQ